MSATIALTFVVLSLLSQVSAFGSCDPKIISNILNSNLKPVTKPKLGYYEGRHFKYHYFSAADKDGIASAEMIFKKSDGKDALDGDYVYYKDGEYTPNIEPQVITSGEEDDYRFYSTKNNADGSISKYQAFVWQVDGVLVLYYCGLDTIDAGEPMYVLETLFSQCSITDEQLQACQDSIDRINNNVHVSLVKLGNPPNSNCLQ